MTVYLILLLCCAALGIFICERRGEKAEFICVCAISAALCLTAALRSGSVGVDFDWIYRDYFIAVNDNLRLDYIFSAANPYRGEFLFTLLNMAIALFTDEPLVLWGISSVIIILLQTIFFLHNSKKPWLSLYLFIALGFFGYSLCYIRQMLALSVAFFALPFLYSKKPLPYFALILAAGAFHNSFFLLLPVYFAAHLPLCRITAAVYAVCYGAALIFSDELIQLFTSIYPRFSLYVENGTFTLGLSFRHAFMWMMLMCVSLFCYPRLKSKSPNALPLINLCLFGTLAMMLITKTIMYHRAALVFQPFFTLLIPEILCAFFPDDSTTISRRADEKRFYFNMMALFMIMALLQFIFSYNVDTLDIFPYSTFWR